MIKNVFYIKINRNKDIPANSVAVGNPCKVIQMLLLQNFIGAITEQVCEKIYLQSNALFLYNSIYLTII